MDRLQLYNFSCKQDSLWNPFLTCTVCQGGRAWTPLRGRRQPRPQRVHVRPHVRVRGGLQRAAPRVALRGGVAAEVLLRGPGRRAAAEAEAEGGCVHAGVVLGDLEAVKHDHPGGLRPLVPRLEVEQQVASQATPSLHRH